MNINVTIERIDSCKLIQ